MTADVKRRERFKTGIRLLEAYNRALEQGLRVLEPALLRELREEATRPAAETSLPSKKQAERFIHLKRHLEARVRAAIGWRRFDPNYATRLGLPRGDGMKVTYRFWPATGKTEILRIGPEDEG